MTLRASGPKGQMRLFVRSEGPDSLLILVGAFGLSTKMSLVVTGRRPVTPEKIQRRLGDLSTRVDFHYIYIVKILSSAQASAAGRSCLRKLAACDIRPSAGGFNNKKGRRPNLGGKIVKTANNTLVKHLFYHHCRW